MRLSTITLIGALAMPVPAGAATVCFNLHGSQPRINANVQTIINDLGVRVEDTNIVAYPDGQVQVWVTLASPPPAIDLPKGVKLCDGTN